MIDNRKCFSQRSRQQHKNMDTKHFQWKRFDKVRNCTNIDLEWTSSCQSKTYGCRFGWIPFNSTNINRIRICVVSMIFNYSFNVVCFHLPQNSISPIPKHSSAPPSKVAHQSFPHLFFCSHVNVTSEHNQSHNQNHIKIENFYLANLILIDSVAIDRKCLSALSMCLKSQTKKKCHFAANLKLIFMLIPFDGNV